MCRTISSCTNTSPATCCRTRGEHPTEGFNESILGTGFWFLGEEVHSPVDIRQDQADRFDNRIDVLTKTFLGLTVACARCHDHKFDAIGTKDYYALYGFLESSTYRLVRFDTLDQNRQVARAARRMESAERQDHCRCAWRVASSRRPRTSPTTCWPRVRRFATGPEFGPAGVSGRASSRISKAGTYANWEVTGTAFGDKPQTLDDDRPLSGEDQRSRQVLRQLAQHPRRRRHGPRGDRSQGTMTSKEFTVSHRIHHDACRRRGARGEDVCEPARRRQGGSHSDRTRIATRCFPVRWDVRDLKGKTARIQIVDDATGGWGNIGVDDIVFTDRAAARCPASKYDASPTSRRRFPGRGSPKSPRREASMRPSWPAGSRRRSEPLTDPNDPFHLWAKVATDPTVDDAEAAGRTDCSAHRAE